MDALPPSLDHLKPYLVRASELNSRHPVIAYYCRYYAAQLGMKAYKSDDKDKSVKSYLTQLLDTLETNKRALNNHPAVQNDSAGKDFVKGFAIDILESAEAEVQNGNIGKDTARAYMAAYNFLEVTNAFGALDNETETMIKYCKYQVTQVMKVVKGELPASSLIKGDSRQSSTGNLADFPSPDDSLPNPPQSTNFVQPNLLPIQHQVSQPSQSTHFMQVQPTPAHATHSVWSTGKLSDIQKAMKITRHAASALAYEDIKTAIDFLEEALGILHSVGEPEYK